MPFIFNIQLIKKAVYKVYTFEDVFYKIDKRLKIFFIQIHVVLYQVESRFSDFSSETIVKF